MPNTYRLSSRNLFHRLKEETKKPKRLIVLSVEGDKTEPSYFKNCNILLDDTIVQIEVLTRKEGDSAISHICETLTEYIKLRKEGVYPEDRELIESLTKEFSEDFINKIFSQDSEIDIKERLRFDEALKQKGIDIRYRRYLKEKSGENDLFAIVLDRDQESHTKKSLLSAIKESKGKNYRFYLSNPCFEFWLLLHVCDVKNKYDGAELEKIRENPKISRAHTFVSHELSKITHHAKTISKAKFKECYAPNIGKAIERAKEFCVDPRKLIDQLGTNLGELMTLIQNSD